MSDFHKRCCGWSPLGTSGRIFMTMLRPHFRQALFSTFFPISAGKAFKESVTRFSEAASGLNLMSDLRSKNVEFCRLMLPVDCFEDHIQMERT
jgi:hypothetical protein